jgi:pimeloyl-ACP methyl ester carboxylesterase
MEHLQREGIDLPYETRGSGDPVVLIHGMAGQIELFEPVTAELSATHTVIAYDRRGHGRSSSRPTPNARRHVRDAAAIIEDVAGGHATVVGWSSGGDVALGLAVDRPDLIRALVVIEPPFHGLRHASTDFLRTFVATKAMAMRGRPADAAEHFVRWSLGYRSGGTAWDEMTDADRDRVRGNGSAVKAETRLHPFPLLLEHVRLSSLAQCSMPMTYLLAQESIPWFHQLHAKLAPTLPSMRTMTVPEVSHALPMQAPGAVVEAVMDAESRVR